jgi:hypothetical protein
MAESWYLAARTIDLDAIHAASGNTMNLSHVQKFLLAADPFSAKRTNFRR